jgi:CRP-like cAMP-binding protein
VRQFARSVGTALSAAAGQVIFAKDDPGQCMYIVQSGTIEILIGDRVVETIGANEALGFMTMIDKRKFRFMVDEVPNFALYIMGVLARRIRGMSNAM